MAVPFDQAAELVHSNADEVPGQPLIQQQDSGKVLQFLEAELSTVRLAPLYWALFLVSKHHNISPLHHQAIKGRQILITERPDLHLVWHYGRIFIKPIPYCLLNYGFFHKFLTAAAGCPVQLRQDAYGFLRTYIGLITHPSDLQIAKSLGLVPSETDWPRWCRFIDSVRFISSAQLSPRYQYGELRLTRLNFYHRLTSTGQSYLEVHHQYLSFFSIFIGPYLFIFGAIAVILAAIQTALTENTESWFKTITPGFCSLAAILSLLGLLFFPFLYAAFQLKELYMFIVHRQRQE